MEGCFKDYGGWYWTSSVQRPIILGAGPVSIWLGEHRELHGNGPVVVHEAQEEEDPPEDDHPVGVGEDHQHGQDNSGDHDLLADLQSHLKILHIVKKNVRKRRSIRNSLVGDDEGDGGGDHARGQEEGSQQGLPRLICAQLVNLLACLVSNTLPGKWSFWVSLWILRTTSATGRSSSLE